MRRVVALHAADALVGRRILLLGDDDLTSVAIRLFVERFGSDATIAQLTVLDVDPALVGFIHGGNCVLRRFRVETLEHDLREPLPPSLRGAFDTVLTDPPYTTAAARLFLSRAAEALAPGSTLFLSFGSRRPGASFALQQAITDSGFAIRRLDRDFNDYLGAGALGGTSHLYVLTATQELRPLIGGRFDEPFYTASVRGR